MAACQKHILSKLLVKNNNENKKNFNPFTFIICLLTRKMSIVSKKRTFLVVFFKHIRCCVHDSFTYSLLKVTNTTDSKVASNTGM